MLNKGIIFLFAFLLSFYVDAQNRFWISATPANWNDPANWSTTTGGAGGATVPGAGNRAIFNANGLGNCTLDIAPTVDGITVSGYTGSIDLSGNILTTTEANTFTTGTIINSGGAASVAFNSIGSTTFNGTQFDADLSGTSGRLFFNGSIFNGTVTLTKSDNNTDTGTGGNTFSGNFSLTHLGTGELRFGNTNPDTFGALTLNINNIGSIVLARTAVGNLFNDNIVINYSSTGNVLFGNTGGTSTLVDTRTLSVTCGGTGCGSLTLVNFTQVGGTPQVIALSGGSNPSLTIGPNSEFDGDVTFTSTQFILTSSVFNGTASITKTGATNNSSSGNTFNGVTIITNSGSSEIFFGNGAADTFNAATTFNNLGSFRIRIAHNHNGATTTFANNLTLNSNKSGGTDQWSFLVGENTNSNVSIGGDLIINCEGTLRSDHRFLNGAGSTLTLGGNLVMNNTNSNANTIITMGVNGTTAYNGNITLTNTGGSNGVTFNSGASASATQAAGGSITIAGGFTSGSINVRRFAQAGASPITLNLGGTTTILRVGPDSSFGGDVDFRSPRLFLNGFTVGGTAYLEKNGATEDSGTGNNIFGGPTTIVNTANGNLRTQGNNTFNSTTNLTNSGTAYLLLELSSGSNYNGAVTFTNTSTSNIRVAFAGTTTFNGNLIFNNPSGTGIVFCETAGATATLADTYTMTVGGSGFSVGTLNLNRFIQVGSTTQNLTLTGTAILNLGPDSQFDGDVNFISPRVLLNGTIFNGSAYIEKNGATGDQGTGNSTFNGTTTLVNSSPAVFRTNGNNTFNGVTTFINSGSQDMLFELGTGSTYNNSVTFQNNGSSSIRVAFNGTNAFNGDIIVENTGGTGVIFCESAAATATLADTRTITVGGLGFNSGDLRLLRFTQVGGTAQSLTLTGTALLTLGSSSSFGGNVTFTSPRVLLNGTSYDGDAYIEKTGVTNDVGTGGNTFNGTTTLVNSGDAYFLTGNTNPDIFNGDLIIINQGASTIRLANNSAGNQFNGNIELNSTFGGGIWFGDGGSATSTLAATRTIGVGGLGVISGDVRLIRFSQVGPTAQTLNLTGIAILTLGPASSFGGDVDFRSPQLLLNGTTYDGTAYLEKNGATNNTSTGGNIFNGTTTLVNSGSGHLLSANSSPDIFDGDLTVTNTGSNIIYLAHNVPGNEFNGNITFNSTLGSGGVFFSTNGPAESTLETGGSLLVGGLGFSSGRLQLRRFTQLGADPQTLLLSGTGLLELGPASTFNGSVDFRSPQFELDGATFNGLTYLEKTGAANNDSNGGNIFNGITNIVNSGSGFFRFALTALDEFNNDVTLTNTGSGTIRMADNIPGTIFNGNIVVNSTAGGGIYFSESGGGTATLAAGRTISIGGSGFSIGDLRLRRFTQSGGTQQTLLLTGISRLLLGPNLIFNGNVDLRAPQLFLQGGTYNGTAYIEKTGATNNTSTGGNTFNGITTLANSGSGEILTGNTNPDLFNAALTVTNTGTNWIRLAENSADNEFNGNVIFNSTSGNGIIIGNAAGGFATLAAGRTFSIGSFTTGELRLRRVTQVGPTAQSLTLTGTALLRIGGNTTFNGDVNFVSPQVSLEGGIFNGTAIIEKNGATNNDNPGGNIFNGTTTLTNSSTARWRLSNTSGDTYNGPVTFIKSSSGAFDPSVNGTDVYESDITINSNTALTLALGTGVVEFRGSNPQTISKTGGTPTPIFRRITLDKAADQVTLTTDINISITATFISGIVNTDAVNVPNFLAGSTVSAASNSSYIDGPVLKTGNTAFTFPIGDGGIYRPISIAAPANATHQFRAQYFFEEQAFGSNWDPSFFTVSGCEYWQLDRTVGTSDVTVSLSWNSADCSGPYINSLPELRVTRWTGAIWENLGNGGTTGDASNGTITTSAAVTSFSPFTLASTSSVNPLPVELLYFRGNTENQLVKLEWRTVSELNNDYFSIERSHDGIIYSALGRVDGNGTTENAIDYQWYDERPLSGLSYYRLKQVDLDGAFEYSPVIVIDLGGLKDTFLVWPNPSTGGIVNLSETSTVKIFDSFGRLIMEKSGVLEISTEGLSAGVYIIRNNKGQQQRLVINP